MKLLLPSRPGVNMNNLADWVPHLIFKDEMKEAGFWSGTTTRDANGWPISGWPTNTKIRGAVDGHYKAGTYSVFFDGTGQIDISRDATATITTSGQTFTVVTTAIGIQVQITSSSASPNHVRNIRVVHADYLASYALHPIRFDFTNFLRTCGSVVRFMDPMGTNNSLQVLWADRPRNDWWTQSSSSSFNPASTHRGLSVEYMVAICNQADMHPHFCMPHAADDDYVTQFATYVLDKLHPHLEPRVEYSNEVWNSSTDFLVQYNYCTAQGAILWPASPPNTQRNRFYKKRALEMFALWRAVFSTEPTRVISLISGHRNNSAELDEIMAWDTGNNSEVDELRIGLYFGSQVANPTAGHAKPLTLDDVFFLIPQEDAINIPAVAANAAIASTYGKPLGAYECGQYLRVSGAWASDTDLIALLHLAQADPRMGRRYAFWFQEMKKLGIDEVLHYADIYNSDNYGSHGLLEWQGEPPSGAPKYDFWAMMASRAPW